MGGLNPYTKRARSVAEYTMMRGVTDFSNASQFNLYEKGYQFLFIITKPKFIEELAKRDADVENLANAFYNILEFEFKGLDGIEDISTETLEWTDGISTMQGIGKVTMQSQTEVSMQFTEKSGSIITKFTDYYLRGIKHPRTQAKTYHGLIKDGVLAAGFENEVFNLLYIATDNTMLSVEKSYLLANAWPTKSNNSIYAGNKSDIGGGATEIDIPFNCFVIDGKEVDERAVKVLANCMGVKDVYNVANKLGQTAITNITDKRGSKDNHIRLDDSEDGNYSTIATKNNSAAFANALENFSKENIPS